MDLVAFPVKVDSIAKWPRWNPTYLISKLKRSGAVDERPHIYNLG